MEGKISKRKYVDALEGGLAASQTAEVKVQEVFQP